MAETLKWNGNILITRESVRKWVQNYCLKSGMKEEDVPEWEWNRDFLSEEEFNFFFDTANFSYSNYMAQLDERNDTVYDARCEFLKSKYIAAVIGNERANYIPWNVKFMPPYVVDIKLTYNGKELAWDKLWKEFGCIKAMELRTKICTSILINGSTCGEQLI